MRDVDTLVETIQRIEWILAEHIEPGHKSDPQETIDHIHLTMDALEAPAAAEASRRDTVCDL
jgi:hypothetical protein